MALCSCCPDTQSFPLIMKQTLQRMRAGGSGLQSLWGLGFWLVGVFVEVLQVGENLPLLQLKLNTVKLSVTVIRNLC